MRKMMNIFGTLTNAYEENASDCIIIGDAMNCSWILKGEGCK